MNSAKSPTPSPSRAVRWVGLFVVPLVLVLLLLLAAEGATRLRQWTKVGTAGSFTSLYRTDDAIGLRVLNPGVRVGRISTNAAGFRGPEITQPKPAGTLRIAFLGASTTFCAEASGDEMVWPHLVVDELKKRYPGVAFDFVNGGVPGYTVASSRQNLRHKVAPLAPDVIVVYHATNDLSAEVNTLAAAAGLGRAHQQPGWLERHSLLWELVAKNLRVMAAQRTPEPGSTAKLQVDSASLGSNFRTELGALLRESSATGARVAVATFSTHLRAGQTADEQKRAAVSALVYMPSMTPQSLVAGYARYNTLIADAARTEAALLIGGENDIPGNPAHFVDSVHFNDEGSRVMAARVAAALAGDARVQELIRQRGR